MTKYTATTNNDFNSLELSFESKPTPAERDALKTLRFRWHSVRKVWYGYKTAEEVAEALKAADEGKQAQATPAPVKPFEIPNDTEIDGGGLYDGWQGGNYSKWNTESELKTLILADFKKCGIKATIRFNRAGYHTSMTITATIPESYILPYSEFEFNPSQIHAGDWLYYNEGEKVECIFGERYFALPDEERAQLFEKIKQYQYEYYKRNIADNNTYYYKESEILTVEGRKVYNLIKSIVHSYNRDCTNSMIDYFDRAIYDSYKFKIA